MAFVKAVFGSRKVVTVSSVDVRAALFVILVIGVGIGVIGSVIVDSEKPAVVVPVPVVEGQPVGAILDPIEIQIAGITSDTRAAQEILRFDTIDGPSPAIAIIEPIQIESIRGITAISIAQIRDIT